MRWAALCAAAVASLGLRFGLGENSNALGSMAGSVEHISHAVAMEMEGSDDEEEDGVVSPLTHMDDALTAGGSEEMWGQGSFFAAPNGGLPLDDTAESAMEGLPDESIQNASSIRRETEHQRPPRSRSPFERRAAQTSPPLKPAAIPATALPHAAPGSFSGGSVPFGQTLQVDSLERGEASSHMSDTLEHAKQGPGTSGSSIFDKTAPTIDAAVLRPKRGRPVHWKASLAILALILSFLAVLFGSQAVAPVVRLPSVGFTDVEEEEQTR